jgi:hypothetical protein
VAESATRRIPRRELLETGQSEGEKVAALPRRKGVNLVDHHRVQVGEKNRAVLVAEQQTERFGRGQQHVRRTDALARLAVRGRVAGAGLDADVEAHLLDRRQEVALHVHRQRLERRDVEGVEGVAAAGFDEVDQAGEEAGQGLAGAGRGDQQGIAPGSRRGEHLDLVAARRPALCREPAGDDRREIGLRHPGADPKPMREMLIGSGSRSGCCPEAASLRLVVVAPGVVLAALRFLRVVKVVSRALGAVDRAARLAVAHERPCQDEHEQQRPDDIQDCPASTTCVHGLIPLAYPPPRFAAEAFQTI